MVRFWQWLKKRFSKKENKPLEEWFDEECEAQRPKWDAAIERERQDVPGTDRKALEKLLAENAAREITTLNSEIDRMLVRTSVIVAAATLLFAVYAIKSRVGLALLLAAIAFVVAIIPLKPPVRRAFFDKYVKRHAWTLLASNDFKRWVLYCWIADRRTPIITTYKRAHAVAVPTLILAAAWLLSGLVIHK